MEQFVILLAVFFGIGAVPPVRWGFRSLALLAVLAALAFIILPVPYDPDVFYHLFLSGLVVLAAAVLAGLILRVVMAVIRPPMLPGPGKTLALVRADAMLKAGAGFVVGCLLFQTLAILLAGMHGGLTLHLIVATMALLAPAALWHSRLRAVSLGIGLTVAALSLDGGLRYPDLILTDANRILPDQPRCLMLGPDLRAPATRADLMALTMAKDRIGPSDVLLRVGPDRLLRWSLKARRFTRAPPYTGKAPLCAPQSTRLPRCPDAPALP